MSQNIDFTTFPKFNVYYNGTINLSGDMKVPFNVKIYDTTSGYDNTTNFKYTVSVSGKYHITSVSSYNGSITRIFLSLYKNGVPLARSADLTANSIYGCALSTDVDLVVGDSLEIWCSLISGSGSFNNNPIYSNSFSGFFII